MPGAIAWVGRAPRPSAWSRAVRALSVSLLSRHPLPAKLTTDPLVHVGRDILAKDRGRRGTAVPVVCPPRTHCALRALLPHPLTRGWGSSGSAAWAHRSVSG